MAKYQDDIEREAKMAQVEMELNDLPAGVSVSPERFAAIMTTLNSCAYDWAKMRAHELADRLMAVTLARLGYDDGVFQFYSMSKWYA